MIKKNLIFIQAFFLFLQNVEAQCDEKKIPFYNSQGQFEICGNFCGGEYFQQTDARECRSSCKKGEVKQNYKLFEANKCIRSKKECIGFISRDGQFCINECSFQEYPVLQDEGYYACYYCFGNIQFDPQGKGNHKCVPECPQSNPVIYEYEDNKKMIRKCVEESFCGLYNKFYLSSDKKYCYKDQCKENEFIDSEGSKVQCVTECSSQNNIRFLNGKSTYCQPTCDYFLSNDNKYCLYRCGHLYEVEPYPGEGKQCKKCDIDEYRRFVSGDKRMECVKDNNTKERFDYLDLARYYSEKIVLQKQFDFFIEELEIILNRMEEYDMNQQVLEKYFKTISNINSLLSQKYRFSPTIIKSSSIRFISQSISQFYENQYNKSLIFSKLKSDTPELIIPYKNEQGQIPDFINDSLLVMISQQNFLCQGSQYPDKCFQNSQLVEVYYGDMWYQQQFTIFFDQDINKNVNKYVCLTTENGMMTKSIKTEVSSNPLGVKCTFKRNTALFYDTDSIFIEKVSCPQDKPYLLNNQICVDTQECSIISGDAKSCVAECSDDYPYKASISLYQHICQKQCKDSQIHYEEGKECFVDKKECKFFLIDNKKCSKNCPDGNFQYTGEQTPYKLCTSACEFKSTENNLCFLQCNNQSIFATVDKQNNPIQKYCDGCPQSSPFQSFLTDKLTACFSECKDNEITHSDLKKCLLSKDECTDYLVDGKICTNYCQEDKFMFTDEVTSYKSCNSSCDLYAFYQNGHKICNSSCLRQHIQDKEDKKCYVEKKDCPKYVSYNGRECSSKCGEDAELQQIQIFGNYKQCRICRDIIQEEETQKGKTKCVTECGNGEMIYVFDIKNQLKKCVASKFCENKKTSAQNSNICSDDCLLPEVKSGDKCKKSCENNEFYSPQDNTCTINSINCNGFLSSDERLCLQKCETIFEIEDKLNLKKCKKCESNEYFTSHQDISSGVLKGVCKQISKAEESLEEMRKGLINKFKEDIKSVQEVVVAQKAVQAYVVEIESKIQEFVRNSLQNQQKSAFQMLLMQSKNFFPKLILKYLWFLQKWELLNQLLNHKIHNLDKDSNFIYLK